MAWQLLADAGRPVAPPLEFCTIEVVRYSPKLPDWDGLYGGLKSFLDCLVVASKRNPHGLGFIVDDNPVVIKRLVAWPEIGKAGLKVTITEI